MKGSMGKGKGIKCNLTFPHSFISNSLQLCISFSTM